MPYFEKALIAEPNNTVLKHNYARACIQLGEHQKAKQSFIQNVKRVPPYLPSLSGLIYAQLFASETEDISFDTEIRSLISHCSKNYPEDKHTSSFPTNAPIKLGIFQRTLENIPAHSF